MIGSVRCFPRHPIGHTIQQIGETFIALLLRRSHRRRQFKTGDPDAVSPQSNSRYAKRPQPWLPAQDSSAQSKVRLPGRAGFQQHSIGERSHFVENCC